MTAIADGKTPCAGCGLEVDRWDSKSIEIAPGREVRLCTKSRDNVKMTCYEAAKKKLHLCEGCGEEMNEHRWKWGRVCDTCQEHIQRTKELGPPPELFWVGLLDEQLFGHYLTTFGKPEGSDEHQAASLAKQLTELLVKAVGGRSQEGCPVGTLSGKCKGNIPTNEDGMGGAHRFDPNCLFVELSEPQIAALREFGKELHRIGEAQFRLGVKHGNNLLGRLASGEVTINEYEERKRRAEGD